MLGNRSRASTLKPRFTGHWTAVWLN